MDTSPDVEMTSLWMAQPRPSQPPRIDDIRARAERLERKTLRWRVLTVALFTLLLLKGTMEVWLQTEMLERAGDLLLMAALVYVAYRYRKQRLALPPVVLGKTTCLEFYRAELVRRRELSEDGWGYLLPFVPGMTVVMLNGLLEARSTSHTVTLVFLGVTLFVGVAAWNAYSARRLQAEIDSLDPPEDDGSPGDW